MSLWLPENQVLIDNPDMLVESLERYRRVLSGAGYAFWEWGIEDNYYRCGGSFWENLGYTTFDESVTGVEHVQEYVHPDDFPMVYREVLDHLRFDTPINMVYRIKAHDGSYWWTQACASSTRDDSGRVTILSGVNFDLSHLKETEKALRLSEARHERILAASNDGIWEWSVDNEHEGGVFHTSHSCWAHLGYSKEEVDSLPEYERLAIWSSHTHPHDLVKFKRGLRMHFTQRTPFDIEYRMFGDDGKVFWIRSRGQAVFTSQGRAILMSGINIDITDIKEAEERVRRAKNEAEKANQAKSHFLSSMSHELRTPLNAIMGFSQLTLLNNKIDQEQRDNSAHIYKAGEHLLRLINDVLDLSKIEAGSVDLNIEPTMLGTVIHDCVELTKPLAEQRGIELTCYLNDQESVYVLADSVRLKQCLLNLMSNAVKYNVDSGTIRINVLGIQNQLIIQVEDSGPGINVDKQKQLFQPFNRLGAENSAIEGSGIGLVITKELLEKMSGSLAYTSSDLGGACFVAMLPIAVNHDVRQSPAVVDSGQSVIELKQFSAKKNIIYIEDNLSNIELVERLFTAYTQLNIKSYEDPFQGLYQVRTQKPDLVLLDINLPYISGLELVRLLKSNSATARIPVVALSANAMPYDIEKGKLSGFDEYLTKPLRMNDLVTVLNRFFAEQAA